MSDQNPAPSTSSTSAYFAGYGSPLATAVKHALENLHIHVTQTLSPDNSPAYCFYFLPQALSTPRTSAKIQGDLEGILDSLGKAVKFCLILRHPDEYYFTHHPTLFTHFSTEENEVLNHQNHLLTCVDIVRKKSSLNSRLIIARNCIGGELDQDAPLLVEAPFLFLPRTVNFLNQSPIVSPITCDDAAKTIIKTIFSQHSRHQIYLIDGSQPVPLSIISQQIADSSRPASAPVIVSVQTKQFHLPSTKISLKPS